MIHLYVKTHRITGLKYFGKTTGDPFTYLGSGVYWRNHLKAHGEDVETEIVRSFEDVDACREFAVKFSADHDIVKSDSWANLMPEDGMNGWPIGENNPSKNMTADRRRACGNAFRGKERPDQSARMRGENNPVFGKSEHTFGLKKFAENSRGKTLEEIFGSERADAIKSKMSSSKIGLKYSLTHRKCPYCCLAGSGPNMARYHFDNCQLNPKNPNNHIGKISVVTKDRRQEVFECPHCHKNGMNEGNMKRWHFDNCKHKI